jgi:hypothetical protein
MWEAAKKGFGLYEQIKKRDTGQVVDPKACGRMVYTFVKEGRFDGPGGHVGPCGVKKDHTRVFCCKECFSHY